MRNVTALEGSICRLGFSLYWFIWKLMVSAICLKLCIECAMLSYHICKWLVLNHHQTFVFGVIISLIFKF